MSAVQDLLAAITGDRGEPLPQLGGLQEARVVTADPAGVRFTIERLGPHELGPAPYLTPLTDGAGAIAPPAVGTVVLVAFLGGDPGRPVVLGRLAAASGPSPWWTRAGAPE